MEVTKKNAVKPLNNNNDDNDSDSELRHSPFNQKFQNFRNGDEW